MSDNPLDGIPTFDRVSIRAVVVHDSEDPGHALSEVGIFDPIALPMVFGEGQPDSFGDGITPNLTAVLEFDQEDGSDPASGNLDAAPVTHNPTPGAQPGTAGSSPDDVRPSRSAATSLPAAYGIQPLAPVRPRGG
jgi:hypothetical protein